MHQACSRQWHEQALSPCAAPACVQVQRGKPHPDVFLAAAALLGVEPARCLAFEDAPSGVQVRPAAAVVLVLVLLTTMLTGPCCHCAGALLHAVPSMELLPRAHGAGQPAGSFGQPGWAGSRCQGAGLWTATVQATQPCPCPCWTHPTYCPTLLLTVSGAFNSCAVPSACRRPWQQACAWWWCLP